MSHVRSPQRAEMRYSEPFNELNVKCKGSCMHFCRWSRLGLYSVGVSAERRVLLIRVFCCPGFFYVKNHGVPQELIDREFEVNTR